MPSELGVYHSRPENYIKIQHQQALLQNSSQVAKSSKHKELGVNKTSQFRNGRIRKL